jgi:hypothetical protein
MSLALLHAPCQRGEIGEGAKSKQSGHGHMLGMTHRPKVS